MPPTPLPRRGIDLADLHAEAQVNATLHLPARTLDWLAKDSRARSLVHSVWDTLTELERSGQYPGAINIAAAGPDAASVHLSGPVPHLPPLGMALQFSLRRVAPDSRRIAWPVPRGRQY